MTNEIHDCKYKPFGHTDDMLICEICDKIVFKDTLNPIPIQVAKDGVVTIGSSVISEHKIVNNKEIVFLWEATALLKRLESETTCEH